MKKRQFASDNYSGICPEALDYIHTANQDDALAYGDDEWTDNAANQLREFFETGCEVFFVFNGTSANSLALASLCQSYHSIICADLAHVETDECGAPEFFSNGSKILLGKTDRGKLELDSIIELVEKRTDVHYPKPRVISLTQSTEVGTTYKVEELLEIRNVADQHGLKIHMDGARFSNALVSTHKSPAELTWKAGIDVLCFGGTKNGLAVGEAVVFFKKKLAEEFEYRCKQAGQLASKMRFLSCQWSALLETGAWKNNAGHANDCAQYFANSIQVLGIKPLFPVESNSLFIELPGNIQQGLRDQGWRFYTFIGAGGVRLMTSWNTKREDIDNFVVDLRNLMGKS